MLFYEIIVNMFWGDYVSMHMRDEMNEDEQYALMGFTMIPAEDEIIPDRSNLQERFPKHEDLIQRYTHKEKDFS